MIKQKYDDDIPDSTESLREANGCHVRSEFLADAIDK